MFPASHFIPHFLICIISVGFPGGSVAKNSPANARDRGSIPGSGRSSEEGNGSPRQYSLLGNPMDRGAWWATVHGVTKELDVTDWLKNNTIISCPSYTIPLDYVGKVYFIVLTYSVSSRLSLFERVPGSTILHCLPRLTHSCQHSSAFSWGNIVIPGT